MTEGYKPSHWGWGFLNDKSNTDRSDLLCSLKEQMGGEGKMTG